MPKRSASGSGTIRQRKDGTWEARYTTGRDPGTGKQIQKSVYGKTQKEVRQKLTVATAAIDNGSYLEPSKLTVGAWLDVWLAEYIENHVKYMTFRSYTQISNTHIKPALAALRLSALNTHTIQTFYNHLHDGKDGKKGLSPKTIKNIHGVFHKALTQAVAIGYMRFNPADACNLPRVVKKEIHPLDDVQVSAFLEAIKGHQYETVYFVTLFSGMRQSEALGLLWECVDFKSGSITVNKQLQKEKTKGGKYFLATVKNDKARIITPASLVMEALQAHKEKLQDWKRIAGSAWENDGYVFCNELGQHLNHITVYKNYKRVVSSIGVPEARYHDMRHTYAVVSIQSGDDIKTVQENLGHHTAAFTLDVYGHVSEKMKHDSAARMDNYIKGIAKG